MEIDSDQKVIRYGISLILINVGMYVVITISFLLRLKRNYKFK
jgi:hypothetical protein